MKSKVLSKLAYALAFTLFAFTASAQEILLENDSYTIYRVEKDDDVYLMYDGDMVAVGMYSLHSILKANPDIDKVSFHSGGGEWLSYKAAKYLHKLNPDLTVTVTAGNWCLSSCAFVLSLFDKGEIHPESVFGFHSPYLPAMPTSKTLQEYANIVSITVTETSESMMENGYSMKLVSLITVTTTPSKYLVFDSFESLQAWRHIGLLERPAVQVGYDYRIMENREIKETMEKNRIE